MACETLANQWCRVWMGRKIVRVVKSNKKKTKEQQQRLPQSQSSLEIWPLRSTTSCQMNSNLIINHVNKRNKSVLKEFSQTFVKQIHTSIHRQKVTFHTMKMFYFHHFFIGWVVVACQREAVKPWPRFSAPSLLVSESWTWVIMTCRTQEWSCCLQDCSVWTVLWKISGEELEVCQWCFFFYVS